MNTEFLNENLENEPFDMEEFVNKWSTNESLKDQLYYAFLVDLQHCGSVTERETLCQEFKESMLANGWNLKDFNDVIRRVSIAR